MPVLEMEYNLLVDKLDFSDKSLSTYDNLKHKKLLNAHIEYKISAPSFFEGNFALCKQI